MIELKDKQGNVIYSTAINNGAKRKFQLMQEDYITLPFSLGSPIDFGLGTNVDFSAGMFEVISLQKPTYNNTTGGYDYQLRLDAYYWKWKNKIFKFTPEVGGQEASWSLTASLDVHMGIFLRNLKALGYTYRGSEFEFSIDATVVNKALSMTYQNMSMIDALSAMAEAWECEWWVTDNIIHFGRCEYGTSVDFEIGVNVAEMTSSASQSSYATRLYVFGSDKNLPANYRPADESVVVNGVVQRRLMLPEGIPYLDAYEGMSEEEAIEEVVILEDVYPKTDGNIASVETYQDSVENEDGTTTTETFYRFRDKEMIFSKDYILEGQELKVKFTSGSLNGMEFGIAFNPKGLAEKNSDGSWNTEAQLYEVVANEDYGRKLPDETLHPKVDDTYVLLNWDSTKIAELGLVSKAEEELYQEGLKVLEKRKIDPNTYNCKMFSDYMYGLDEEGNQDNTLSRIFEAGDKVRLINDAFFKDGRESRIVGYEYNLDFPFDSPMFIVGETASYSRLGALESKLESLTYGGQTYTGGGGSGVYLIGTNDSTKPSNRNAYSALNTNRLFLRKDKDDRSKGKISSDKAIEVGNYVSGASGAIIYKDAKTGQTVGEMDKLYIRMKAYFETLEIINVNSIGGKQILSPAGSVKCIGVEELANAYRCYFLAEQDSEKVQNRFVVGDQIYSQMFDAVEGTSHNVSTHYFWRLCTGSSKEAIEFEGKKCHYIDLSITDCDKDSDVPFVGDVLNQRGNRTDLDRMNFIEQSSVDAFSPNITLFHGVNSYSLDGKAYVSYGVDKSTNKAFMYVYGDMYVGDRNGGSYMRYTQEDGLEISGRLSVDTKLGDSTLKDLISASSPEGYQEFVEKVTQDIEGLQAQIDGAIESYFFQYDPTLGNYPASEWITEEQKKAHLNDTFTNLISGYSWRWAVDNGVYGWTEITDTATSKALALAGQAQDTADGKRRVFVDTPKPPYDLGDLWSRGSEYPLMICVKTKDKNGVYEASDFDYADNNAKLKEEMQDLVGKTKDELSNAIGQAKDEAVNNANAYTDEGKKALQASINAMESSKANLDDVYTRAQADGKISQAETNAINAAKEEADAAIALSEITIKAYADGIVDDEEAARIKQAQENLQAAKDYADQKAQEAFNAIAGYEYLQAALGKAQGTEVQNGLVLTSLIQLRNTNGNIMSGINGLTAKGDKSIANWWGGDMLDMTDYCEWNGKEWVVKPNSTMPNNVPKGLIRMDATGYLANGKFWWDDEGRIYADPRALFLMFDVNEEAANLSTTIIALRDKQTEFESMWRFETDKNGQKYLYSTYPLVTQGPISMMSNNGASVPSLFDSLPIDGTTIYWENGILKAAGGGTGGGGSIDYPLSWSGFSSGSFDGSAAKTIYIPSKLSELTNDASYAKTSDLSDYLPKSGGTITGDLSLNQYLRINAWIGYGNGSANFWYDGTQGLVKIEAQGIEVNGYRVIGTNNYYQYALPLTGGELSGNLHFGPDSTGENAMGASTRLPSHIYRNVYDNSGNVYDHYYNNEYRASSNTFANLRVKSENGYYRVLRFGGDGTFVWDGNTIIHSGNIGSQSVSYATSAGDADTLDGCHATNLVRNLNLRDATNKLLSTKVFTMGVSNKGDDPNQSECPTWYGAYISVQYDESKNSGYQLYGNTSTAIPTLFVRNRRAGDTNTNYNSWKEIAFIDSNVASATKLQTARTIWGQSFDGTGNVSGHLTGALSLRFNGDIGIWQGNIWSSLNTDDIAYYATRHLFWGNVGIGTTSPSAKLHIAGTIRAENHISINSSNWGEFSVTRTGYGISSIGGIDNNGVYFAHVTDSTTTYMYLKAGFGLTVHSNILTTGSITMNSMRAMKNIINENGLSLEELSTIKPTRFTWKDGRDDRLHIGGIADDVMKILPEVVFEGSDGVLSMDYASAAFAIGASLIKPVSEHELKIKKLECKVQELENELKLLKSA